MERNSWRCVHPGCPGRIHTINDSVENGTAQVVHFKDHDHFADATAAHTIDVKAELCKMAAEQSHVPLKQLYTEFSRRPEIVAAAETIPGFESCKTQMHRARQQVMPPVPTARTDINLEGEWKETTTGQNFLLHQDEEAVSSILVRQSTKKSRSTTSATSTLQTQM